MKKKRKPAEVMLFYIIPLAIVLLLQGFGAFKSLENSAEDFAYQSAGITSPNIYVIGIDEETLSEYGQFENWSRKKTAELINYLTADKENSPSVIAIDIGFYSEKNEEDDRELVEAVRNAGNVVLVSSATFDNVVSDDGEAVARKTVLLEEPFDELKSAAAATGHSNVEFDGDGIVRHALGPIEYNGEKINSFAYEIYKLYTGNDTEFNLTNGKYYITFKGESRDYFGSGVTGCSLCRVLDGTYGAAAFKNSVVLLGAFATGLQDSYYTSVDSTQLMYGVEIHANILEQYIDGVQKKEISLIPSLAITALLGLLATALVTFVDTKISVPVILVAGAGYYFLSKFVYSDFDTLLPIVFPIAVIVFVAITHILIRYFSVHLEKKRIISNYGKYLSPEIAATIADVGEESLKLGGTKKDVAVLFADIRGFTTISESLPPEKVVEMLNSYLEITTKAIFDNKGTVDKFIGDATMGLFNAPLDLDDYVYRAVCAGLEMKKLARGIDDKLSPELRGKVGFGVGINCGDAIVGNIGTEFRMDYTAVGDTVNTASRLEGQAKAGCVVISNSVYERVKDRVRCEDMGKVKLRGKAEEQQIWLAVEIIDN